MELLEVHELMTLEPEAYIDEIDKLGSDDLRTVARYAYGLARANQCQFIDKGITVWQRVIQD